jgi:hypothetical protein
MHVRKLLTNSKILFFGSSNDAPTPDLHHHVIDLAIVKKFEPLLAKKNPFKEFETKDAAEIELVGRPKNYSPVGYIGRDLPALDFSERHAYYSWYCVKLASALSVNYVPSPIRVDFLNDRDFIKREPFANLRKDIIDYSEKTRRKLYGGVQEIFKSLQVSFELPLIYNYIKSRSNDNNIVAETMNLRESEPARAYREYCRELDDTFVNKNNEDFVKKTNEIKTLAEQWSQTLTRERAKKTWSISPLPFLSTDFKTPWFNISAPDRKPHFIFIHSLLSRAL